MAADRPLGGIEDLLAVDDGLAAGRPARSAAWALAHRRDQSPPATVITWPVTQLPAGLAR